MAHSQPSSGLQDLIVLAQSSLALFKQFSASLRTPKSTPAAKLPANHSPPLPLLRDAALLLKAQTTKLSLLLINPPFTPSAIAKVVREISGTCVPAMMSAVELCNPQACGKILSGEVRWRVSDVVRELEILFNETLSIAERGGEALETSAGRNCLTSTGVVWEACDALIQLEKTGLIALLVQKAEGWRDMVKDAIEELKEWAEEDDGGDESRVDGAGGTDDEEDSNEDLYPTERLPKGNDLLRNHVQETLKKLKTASMIYPALIKRRIKTFPVGNFGHGGKSQETLDQLAELLKDIPTGVDDLAAAYYELDSDEAANVLAECIRKAKQAASLVSTNWDGTHDEFTAWSEKWAIAIS